MQQLTDEDIAKVFHLYHNANVTTKLQIDANGYNYGAFKYWYIQHEQVMVHPTGLCNHVVATDAKLLLTPLSKITDEHAIEVAKLCGLTNAVVDRNEPDAVLLKDDSYVLQISKQTAYIVMRKNGNLYNMNMILPFQYLIQQGYAVPIFISLKHSLNGKTPIELGIAIDKTLSND